MSPEHVGSSPVPTEAATVGARAGALLDWLQAAGPAPTVNPARTRWEAPTLHRGPGFWFLAAFLATATLVLFWFFGADTSGGFIYAGF